MSKLKLRSLLSRLAACATLTASAVAPSVATAATVDSEAQCGNCDCLESIDDDRPIDRENLAATEAAKLLGRSLALALGDARPLAATQVAATWATSEDPVRRLAVANALEWTFPLVGDALMIDHLSRDVEPEIRVAAARAAWLRRATGGDAGVLDRLSADPDPAVRSVATSAR